LFGLFLQNESIVYVRVQQKMKLVISLASTGVKVSNRFVRI